MATKNKTHSGKTGKTPKNGSPKNVTPLRKIEALERLRDRVEAAADEILRLRAENEEMAKSINDLRNKLDSQNSRPAISFDGDADDLRDKVRGFIDAIDTYLDHETGAG